jgi:hypothetical protein
MRASSSPNEQLATLGVHLLAWPEEPEDDEPDNWIKRGQVYAEGMRLWRAQLHTATEMEGSDGRRLVNKMQSFGALPAFYQSVIRYLLSSLNSGDSYECTDAAAQLLAHDDLTSAQQLGVALELARAGFTRLSVQLIKRIIEIYHPSEVQCLELCALLVENQSTVRGSQDQSGREDVESWRQSLDLYIEATSVLASAIKLSSGEQNQSELLQRLETLSRIAAADTSNIWNRWESVRSETCEYLLKGDSQEALNMVQDWVKSRCDIAPEGVDEKAYAELLLNTCSIGDRQQPLRWLIESRSLPRSGHHFLKGILRHAWGEDFSYCERYNEPGCCKASPCTVSAYWHFALKHHKPHLRLLKSHDFALTDATFDPPPGMVRLIQVRQPLDLLVSWLELEQLTHNRSLLADAGISLERIFLYHEPQLLEAVWMLVDKAGTIMSADQVQQWLEEKVCYVVGFLYKWLPVAKRLPAACSGLLGGNILLRYEDLGEYQVLLQALGRDDLNSQQLPAFAPRHRVMKRPSLRVSDLIEVSRPLLIQADADVMAAVPEMRILYR